VQAVAEVFSQALASTWTAATSTDDAAVPADDSHLCIALTASGGLQGAAAFQIKNSDALLLALKFLAEPIDENAKLDDGRKEAVEELMRQVAGVAATKMKSVFGEVQLQVSTANSPAAPGVTVALLLSDNTGTKMQAVLLLGADLLASASSHQKVEATAAEQKVENRNDDDAGDPDRVMGVRLKLSLRFGQRLLTLREIVGLRSGTVVELDRHVEEPVDLVIGNKVIARGHVVVVDGDYGLRITEANGN